MLLAAVKGKFFSLALLFKRKTWSVHPGPKTVPLNLRLTSGGTLGEQDSVLYKPSCCSGLEPPQIRGWKKSTSSAVNGTEEDEHLGQTGMPGYNLPDPASTSGSDTGLAASRDWCCRLSFPLWLFQVVTGYVWIRTSKTFFFYFDLESVITIVLCDSSLNFRLCAVLYAQIFILLCTLVIIDCKGLRRGWRPWAGRFLCSVDNQTEPNSCLQVILPDFGGCRTFGLWIEWEFSVLSDFFSRAVSILGAQLIDVLPGFDSFSLQNGHLSDSLKRCAYIQTNTDFYLQMQMV